MFKELLIRCNYSGDKKCMVIIIEYNQNKHQYQNKNKEIV